MEADLETEPRLLWVVWVQYWEDLVESHYHPVGLVAGNLVVEARSSCWFLDRDPRRLEGHLC